MELKRKLWVIATSILTTACTFSLVGCGGSNEKVDIFSLGALEGQVMEKDIDGTPYFDDVVELTMWSIIGEPDQSVFRKMIDEFNKKYTGMIHINVVYQGHNDYYSALDRTYASDFDNSFPDICFMHNEKTVESAYKGYLYPLDDLFEATGVNFDFTQTYENINRVTEYKGYKYAIPVDAHGFVTQFRQDIIKKNNLGFENNTRFIPENADEYQTLLENLRTKADEGTLLIRNINKGEDHSWHYADKDTFYPSFMQSTDPDGLSALYSNGGSLVNETQDTVTFHQNSGFQKYLTDQVDRYNNRLMSDASGTNVEMFSTGNTAMFPEGPWWVAQLYSSSWNNSELRQEGNGVSAEDAADPIISKPYIASRPIKWWATEENKDTELAGKWYGNGHAISLTRHITDIKKAAAALIFANWYTQGLNKDGDYNLVKWCESGHLPAWKNVYASDEFAEVKNYNMTLQALGDPQDIIAMEGLEYEAEIFNGLQRACVVVIDALKQSDGCTKEEAIEILNDSADSTQAALDLLKMNAL